MSRVEELPDDFDERLDLNKHPDIPSFDDMFAKAPHHDSHIKDFSSTPLFMDNLDVANDAENEGLEALRALQYEGTKSEVAQNFKDQGNEMVKEKRWSDAKEFYTKGIAVLTDRSVDRYEQGEEPDTELQKQRGLEEIIYVNRALCNLELKNYRSTTLDCAATLRSNPNNIKAHYRSARALLALDRLEEANDICSRGLGLDPSNTPLAELLDRIKARADAKREKDQKAARVQQRKAREKVTLFAALKARNIKLRGSEKPPDLEDAAIRLAPDPLSPKSLLEFPTMFLYPMHAQSDFVKAFAEKDTIVDHLSYLLPLPWDVRKEYNVETIDCFMDTSTGGLMKVGKKLTLLEALTSGKSEVVDGLVRVHVVPTNLSAKWVEEVKKKKNR